MALKIGIMGAGAIAATMAHTIKNLKHPEISLYAIASRSAEKAAAFARDFGVQHAFGSYEDMLADPEVNLIYIATPHSEHYHNIQSCIRAKKGMLVEKSFTANAAQAREVLQQAAAAQVFITEAIWTRYMPSRKIIADALSAGAIGEVRAIQANLSYPITNKARIMEPALAGGALLDLGVYPINFAMMFFGHDLSSICGCCIKGTSGVDLIDNIALTFADGKFASLMANACSPSDRMGYIYGDTGYLAVTNINNPEKIELFNKNHEIIKTYDLPPQISGYEYELLSCLNEQKHGRLSCPEMSHQETIEIMEVMDKLRADWDIKFPFE